MGDIHTKVAYWASMETTRHFTATVYVVNDGATALHEHKRHGVHNPPGGQIDRDELPHEAGLREVHEEMGLEATLLDDTSDLSAPNVEMLPQPRHHLLYDINVHEETVGHQHIDLIYYATVSTREITPDEDEAAADAWSWYAPAELRELDIDEDVATLGIETIQTAQEH